MQLTPMLQQYVEIKKLHPECLLFFRVGDFYETYFEDAELLNQKLDFALTDKSKAKDGSVKMAGIPHFSLDKYLPRLLNLGFKIAVAEQMTDPVPGRLVQREITQIITPGTYIQEGQNTFNYLFALTHQETKDGLSFHVSRGDFSLGEYRTKSFSTLAEVQKWILTITPSEIIIDVDFPDKDSVSLPIQQYLNCPVSIYEIPNDPELFLTNLCNIQTLSSFGQATQQGRLHAITLLLNYLKHTQINALQNIHKISYHTQASRVLMDDITIKNLEIFASSYEQSEKYSLCGVIDNTVTHAGSRLLKYRLLNPINDLTQLTTRNHHIARYQAHPSTSEFLKALRGSFDVNKLISCMMYKKLTPTSFIKLRTTLSIFFDAQKPLHDELQTQLTMLGCSNDEKDQLFSLFSLLQQALKADEQISFPTDYIQDQYDETIDQLRKIAYHSDEALLDYQQMLVKASGINNVKLKFVMNQGYFIEVTQKDAQAFIAGIQQSLQQATTEEVEKLQVVQRQTLKGNVRFVSPYLETLQSTILSAKDQLAAQEFRVLTTLKDQIIQTSSALFSFANCLAEFDVYASHAVFARDHNYVQPELTHETTFKIKGGRHPVIEKFLPADQPFIPNDLMLGNARGDASGTHPNDQNGLIHIITGPNMGGKSTYLRQSALIVLLAHCGLFVPAESARIGLIDGLFARVGSGDVIAKNQSTFMTEMIEVSNILNNATANSFIIFDELGRGTSTYDGMALTSAILLYLLKHLKTKTLLATHYHELIQLENQYPEIRNFSVSVYETDKEVIFMKKIVKGGANKSYGIDVAQLAGIPGEVLTQARDTLKKLEQHTQENKQSLTGNHGQTIVNAPLFQIEDERAQYEKKYKKIERILSQTDTDNMTPLQALQFLVKIKEELQ